MNARPGARDDALQVAAIVVAHGSKRCEKLARHLEKYGLRVMAIWNVSGRPRIGKLQDATGVADVLGERYDRDAREPWRTSPFETKRVHAALEGVVGRRPDTCFFVFIDKTTRRVDRRESQHFVYWRLKALFDSRSLENLELLQEPFDFSQDEVAEEICVQPRCASIAPRAAGLSRYRSFSVDSTLMFLRVIARENDAQIWLEGVWLRPGEHMPSRKPEDDHWKIECLARLPGRSIRPRSGAPFEDTYRHTEMLWLPTLHAWIAFDVHDHARRPFTGQVPYDAELPVKVRVLGPFACRDEPPPASTHLLSRRNYKLGGLRPESGVPGGRFRQLIEACDF